MKRLCVLQVTPKKPNPDHVSFFENKEDCDFFFVTHDSPNEKALKFCPNTTWVDTRNILADLVPKEYEYYAFVDYDFIFEPKGTLGVLEQILFDLNKLYLNQNLLMIDLIIHNNHQKSLEDLDQNLLD